jgi:hypothetical protein
MTRYRDATELPSHLRAQVTGKAAARPAGAAKRSKYGNQRVLLDGQWFDSKLEAERYQYLCLMRKAGAVRWFARQVNFVLPGGVKYRADFVEVWAAVDVAQLPPAGISDQALVVDCKGVLTRECANKLKQMEACLGIKVWLANRQGFGKSWLLEYWGNHAAT